MRVVVKLLWLDGKMFVAEALDARQRPDAHRLQTHPERTDALNALVAR
jgi:hypothetical protein